MRAYYSFLVVLMGCGGPGAVRASWQGATGPSTMRTEGTGAWCPETRMILVDATENDDAVGVVWRYDVGGPTTGSFELTVPSDSIPAAAAAALRYVHLDEIRGFRSTAGTLTITAVDTLTVSGHLSGSMQRVGDADSTTLEMAFHEVPLGRDATVCVEPPARPGMTPPTDPAADTMSARRDTLIHR